LQAHLGLKNMGLFAGGLERVGLKKGIVPDEIG
jgi:hypothetical protein